MRAQLLKNIDKQKKKIARLEAAIAKKTATALAGIHSQYGFESLNAFFRAVRAANSDVAPSSRGMSAGKKARRKRTKITTELKAKVIAELKRGKTGAAVAAATRISLPSVQKIKKEAGLVKTR